jgi:uncharacterized repeat protein (TIGR03803 family)
MGHRVRVDTQDRGTWTYKVLSERSGGPIGGNLILDASGNLYGTTVGGGLYGFGYVFELSPSASGKWTGKVLHCFNNNGTDGVNPCGSLVLSAAGKLYGATVNGGAEPCSNDS